ncbi:hypothetical protein P7K49_014884, partial [Saguinus oedipus]
MKCQSNLAKTCEGKTAPGTRSNATSHQNHNILQANVQLLSNRILLSPAVYPEDSKDTDASGKPMVDEAVLCCQKSPDEALVSTLSAPSP